MNAVPVVPGAEPFTLEGGPTGILLLHGFTSNPFGLRPFGEWLAKQGYTVLAPRYPGHGTTWEDLERTTWADWESEADRALTELRERCDAVAVVGLSFGGAMALHLAARRPDDVRALVLVNPYVLDRRIAFAPVVRWFRRAVSGVADDIARDGQTERAYTRIPVAALAQMARFLGTVRGEIPQVNQPILVFDSEQDHVVPKGNAALVLRRVASRDKELVPLSHSYHVAWLDEDAERIFQATHDFVSARVGAPA